MGKKLDLTGQKFGRLTVVSEAGKSETGKLLWSCECSCGANAVVHGSDLRGGKLIIDKQFQSFNQNVQALMGRRSADDPHNQALSNYLFGKVNQL